MSDAQKPTIHLSFSDKYTDFHSQEYFHKHNENKLSDRMEHHRMAARALGHAGMVLGVP